MALFIPGLEGFEPSDDGVRVRCRKPVESAWLLGLQIYVLVRLTYKLTYLFRHIVQHSSRLAIIVCSVKSEILDEWLIQDLSKDDVAFIFELSERRFDTTSTVFCTQLSIKTYWKLRIYNNKEAVPDMITTHLS